MGSLIDIRRQMMAADHGLPYGYRQIDYVQTVGTASFFDTGVAGNDNTIEIDFKLMPLARGSYSGGIIANQDADTSKRCWRILQGATGNDNRWTITVNNRRAASSSSIICTDFDTILGHTFTFHLEYGYAYVDCEGHRYSVTPTVDTYETTSEAIYVGANGRTSSHNASAASHRFYDSIKIRKQGKLIRDYRPCIRKSDSKVGFYDMVNHTFNYSAGNRQFVAPS